jgi:serine/threonine protein kinase
MNNIAPDGKRGPDPQVRELFLGAVEKRDSREREDYLDRACGGDAALRAEVESLLRAYREDSFLNKPAGDLPTVLVRETMMAGEKPGEQIGRYRLLEKIGEGGFGVVYVAEQREPVRRRVALKIVKLGMDTRQVVARFEAERQAMSMMDHPNIAKALDAGATDSGRPYFVMELVRGVKITEYCDENNLPAGRRLDLFMDVCRAIQHAHQKGVIHRDIKPSNILVTVNDGEPVPKVIDFGIAKATQGELTDKTVYTQFQQFMGTPAYMSPEQAAMTSGEVDTRSDVYSLGVLLYELLTGTTPFDSRELLKAGLDEMRRTIREREPLRPSIRFDGMKVEERTKTARRRQTEPAKLASLVRGDLDWIVMKALEKDRTRRYETASGLAADVQRHLKNEPVAARPPDNFYRLRKLVRRNKTVFGAIAAVAVSLLASTLVSGWLYFRASEARESERQLRLQVEQIRRELAAQPGSESRTARGQWPDDSPSAAGYSPLFRKTIADYIEDCLQQNTAEALDEAARMAAGDPNYLRRIADARRKLADATGGLPKRSPSTPQ